MSDSPPIKTLTCEYKNWNKKKVVSLPVIKLFQSVPTAHKFGGVPFYQSVMDDIEKEGLHFPLLIVECQFWQLLEQYAIHKKHMRELPKNFDSKDTIWVVWGGSNRLAAAKELGYTHIDCVMYKNGDFKDAHKDQGLHRKPYMHFYSKAAPKKANIRKPPTIR